MKKYLTLVLAIVMTFSMLTACGNDKKPAETATTTEEKKPENLLADKSLEEILEAVYKEKMPEFPLLSTTVDLTDENSVKYFTGLTADDSGKIKEAIASEPAMGSQAYSLVLIRLNDEKDAEDIAAKVKAGIDPRKWICVEADDMRACASGDVVMFVMISTTFADSITATQLTDAFTTVAGGSLSVEAN